LYWIKISDGKVEKTDPRSTDYPTDYPTDYSTDYPTDYPYGLPIIINQIPFYEVEKYKKHQETYLLHLHDQN